MADRQNARIVIFDQEGKYINRWTQFGMPSDIAIDANGKIYVADSESDMTQNAGWEKGIRIGDVATGSSISSWRRATTRRSRPEAAGPSRSPRIGRETSSPANRAQRLHKYVKVL